jgi:hypothetical protein
VIDFPMCEVEAEDMGIGVVFAELGVRLFPSRDAIVTNGDVNRLREELGI